MSARERVLFVVVSEFTVVALAVGILNIRKEVGKTDLREMHKRRGRNRSRGRGACILDGK
jgi:hypothetical protein